jgi:hypothetical protein
LTRFATGTGEDVGGNLRLDGKEYTYIDGTCEIRLPVGDIAVEIHKGLEYRRVTQKVSLPQGKLSLRFEIERWSDRRRQGWYAGDIHSYHLSPHAALLEGAAEDLAVVNILACEARTPGTGAKDFEAITNILAFSGQEPALAWPGHLVAVNTLNRHRRFGTLALLNCHRVVYPLTFGSPEEVDEWNLADVAGQCHRKGGLVVGLDYLQGQPEHVSEALADLLLGYIDVLNVPARTFQNWADFGLWQELLCIGLRIPLVSGSGKASNGQRLGSPRTYAQLLPGEELTYEHWIEAVRAGRTFVSNGPLLLLTANGQGPGTLIRLDPSQDPVALHAEAYSFVPFQRLEILHKDCIVVTVTAQLDNGMWIARFDGELSVTEPCWLSARCSGVIEADQGTSVGAHTSAIYLEPAGSPLRPDAATLRVLHGRLERTQHWISENGRFSSEAQRERMLHVYREAQAVLGRRARDELS